MWLFITIVPLLCNSTFSSIPQNTSYYQCMAL